MASIDILGLEAFYLANLPVKPNRDFNDLNLTDCPSGAKNHSEKEERDEARKAIHSGMAGVEETNIRNRHHTNRIQAPARQDDSPVKDLPRSEWFSHPPTAGSGPIPHP